MIKVYLYRLRLALLKALRGTPEENAAKALQDVTADACKLQSEVDRRQRYNVAIRAELQTLYDNAEAVKAQAVAAETALKTSAAIEAQNAELSAQLQAIGAVLVSDFRDRCIDDEPVHAAVTRIARDLFRERADFEALARPVPPIASTCEHKRRQIATQIATTCIDCGADLTASAGDATKGD